MEKERFMQLLQKAGLNKKEFAKIANISYGTVNNWGQKKNANKKITPIPNWVEPFMHYYFKAKELDYVTEEICRKLQKVKEKDSGDSL